MLAQLRSGDVRRGVDGHAAIALYTAIDDHLARVVGTMRKCVGDAAVFPYFFVDSNGKLVRQGSFASGRPFQPVLHAARG